MSDYARRSRYDNDVEDREERDHDARPERWPGKRTSFTAPISRHATGSPGKFSGAMLERAARSSGSPLPEDLRSSLESRLGADLSGVRIHTGGDAAAAADEVSARAYTVGRDIYFGAGEYDPSSRAGRELLAHEVAHTVQSTPLGDGEISTPDQPHEVEADRFARSFASDGGGDSAAAAHPLVRATAPASGAIHRVNKIKTTTYQKGPDLTVFEKQDIVKRDVSLIDKQVTMLDKIILVGEAPVRAQVTGGVKGNAWFNGSYGAGTITGMQVEDSPTGMIQDNRLPGKIIPAPATATVTVPIQFAGGVSAKLSVDAGIGDPTATMSAGVFASVGASAVGSDTATLTGKIKGKYSSVTGPEFAPIELAVANDIKFTFSVFAEAGVWVKLKLPSIPWLSDVISAPSWWPARWSMPDLNTPLWEKRWSRQFVPWTKSWDKAHKVTGTMRVGMQPHGGQYGLFLDEAGKFDAAAVIEAAKNEAGLTKDVPAGDDGPPSDQASGPTAAAVAGARATAKGSVRGARDAIAHERDRTQKALVKAIERAERGKTSGPQVVRAGGPPDDTIGKLNDKQKKLDDLQKGADLLDQRADKVVSGNDPNPQARNQSVKALNGLGTNAQTLQSEAQKQDAALGDNESLSAEAEAAIEKARKAMNAANLRIDSERVWSQDRIAACGASVELATYKKGLEAHDHGYDLLEESIRAAEDDLDKARGAATSADAITAAGRIEARANAVDGELARMISSRPKETWDKTWAMIFQEDLWLVPELQHYEQVRNKLYGKSYRTETNQWKKKQLVKRTGPVTKQEEWCWMGNELSPRGDNWWIINDDAEGPTIGHNDPSLGAHWNSTGRGVTQTARKDWFNGSGDRDEHLELEPRVVNSRKAGATPVPVTFRVKVTFRGPGS